jgi:hypothetical protein
MKLQQYLLSAVLLAVALAVMAIPVSADMTTIAQGGDVFIGEAGLDITTPMGGFTQAAWFTPGTDPLTDTPSAVYTIPISSQSSYYINPTLYEGKVGNWYRWDGGSNRGNVSFNVVDPAISIKIWDQDTDLDVTGQSIPIGNYGNFRIETNLYTITTRPGYANEGFITIKVQSPEGGIYTSLYESDLVQLPLTDLKVDQDLWYWEAKGVSGDGWYTAQLYNYARVYKDGLYKVWAQSNVNGIKDNYKNPSGGDYTGKTVSVQKSVTLESKPLTLTPNKASLIRGNPFSVEVSGDPNTVYIVWIQYECEKLSGLECEQPPMVVFGQEGIEQDLQYMYDCACFECNGCIVNLFDVLAEYPEENYYYAIVTTNETGMATMEFQTSLDTMEGTYTIGGLMVEDDLCTEPHIPTEASVTIYMGEIDFNLYVYGQITSQTYLGEKIWIRGTNTDPSGWVYLFMTGPCQPCEGVDLSATNTVVYGDPDTFTKVEVESDGSWEYLWDTSNLKIDLGDYTIYAASKPNDAPSLEGVACNDCEDVEYSCAAWAKKPLTFLDPEIIADIHPKVLSIECCEEPDIIVSGYATGIREDECESCPCKNAYVAYWVFGENKVAGEKYIFNTVEPECPNGEFSFNIKDDINALRLLPGTYTVIVQHPMYNHKLDVIPDTSPLMFTQYWWWVYTWDTSKTYVVSATPVVWSKLFQIDGTGRLVGTAASDALIAGLNDPNIDDTYLVLTFKVESNTATMADFSGMPTSGSAPLEVQFTDISKGLPPTAWLWDFGDGMGTSTLQHPTYTYQNAGTYDVTLTVTGPAGTSSITKNDYITVGTGPTPTVTPTVSPTPGGSEIDLNPGWNFISTPKRLADGYNTAGVVFGGVDTGGRSIYLYDASTGMWDSMSASSLVKPLDGIWIYSVYPIDIPLTFKTGGADLPPTKWVYQGWNAIGFSDTTPVSARMTLLSVDNPPNVKWSQVIGYNSASQSYESAIFNADPSYNTLMQPTKGYWLYMTGQYPPWELAAISA